LKRQPLPRLLTDLWISLEELPHPPAVLEVRQVVWAALGTANPPGALNSGIRHLKHRAATLRNVRSWLDNPLVMAAAGRGGAHWTLSRWRIALDAIMAGQAPHAAFGMSAPGRRHSATFSLHDNLAAYVEHAVRNGGAAGPTMGTIQAVLKNRAPGDREIRWARKKIGALSNDDVAAMAEVTRQLLKLP
jgi:hypothetical protein